MARTYSFKSIAIVNTISPLSGQLEYTLKGI